MTFIQRWIKRWLWLRKTPFFCSYSRIWMRLNGCVVPSSCHIFKNPYLYRLEGKLILGERVMVNSLPFLHRLGQEFRSEFSTSKQGLITIGDDTGINGAAFYAEKKITIGKRVMIGGGCRVTDVDFHPIDVVPRRYAAANTLPEPVVIEDDVWLGMEVFVMPGVTIGKGSVVAARSVVTHDIPPMVVAAGIPARVIRQLDLKS